MTTERIYRVQLDGGRVEKIWVAKCVGDGDVEVCVVIGHAFVLEI